MTHNPIVLYPIPRKAKNRIFELLRPWTSKRRLHDLDVFLNQSDSRIPVSTTGLEKPERGLKRMGERKKKHYRAYAQYKREGLCGQVQGLTSEISPESIGELTKVHAGIWHQAAQRESPSILQDLLGHSSKQDNGILDVDLNNDARKIAHILECLSGVHGRPHFVFTVGIGGTQTLPSVRLPAHVIYPLDAMRKLKRYAEKRKIKIDIELQIFRADNIGAYANGYDLTKVQEASKQTLYFLRKFCHRFYPDLNDNVIIEADNPIDTQSERFQLLQSSVSIIKTAPAIDQHRRAVQKMGTSKGGVLGSNNSFLYASAHPFYNGSIILPEYLHFRQSLERIHPHSIVLDYGGKSQNTFNQIGKVLISHFERQFTIPTLVNILHTSCRTPGYYLLETGGTDDRHIADIVLSAEPQDRTSIKGFGRFSSDMRAISKALGGLQLYKDFLSSEFDVSW